MCAGMAMIGILYFVAIGNIEMGLALAAIVAAMAIILFARKGS